MPEREYAKVTSSVDFPTPCSRDEATHYRNVRTILGVRFAGPWRRIRERNTREH